MVSYPTVQTTTAAYMSQASILRKPCFCINATNTPQENATPNTSCGTAIQRLANGYKQARQKPKAANHVACQVRKTVSASAIRLNTTKTTAASVVDIFFAAKGIIQIITRKNLNLFGNKHNYLQKIKVLKFKLDRTLVE